MQLKIHPEAKHEMSGNKPGVDELRYQFLAPPMLVLDILHIIHFSRVLSLLTNKKNLNALPLKILSGGILRFSTASVPLVAVSYFNFFLPIQVVRMAGLIRL